MRRGDFRVGAPGLGQVGARVKLIYEDPKYLAVYHNPDLHYLHLRWREFDISLEGIQRMHKEILEYAIAHRVYYYVADTGSVESILKPEIIGWWRSVWIAEMQNAGIEIIATIEPADTMAKVSTQEWQTGKYEYTSLVNVADIAEAEGIFAEHEKRFANATFETVDEYIKTFHNRVRFKLCEMREIIQGVAPEAREKISYRIPTFDLYGNLVHFAGFENHIGFYPTSSGIARFAAELEPYEHSKGAVRFPLDAELPVDLIQEIVEFRKRENVGKHERKRGL